MENSQNGVDLRFWKIDTIPTKVGVSLSLPHWKVLCSATQVVDDLFSRVKDREPVDWRYDLGEDVYVIIKDSQLTIHIRKYFCVNHSYTQRNLLLPPSSFYLLLLLLLLLSK